jgi:hypothetical protein
LAEAKLNPFAEKLPRGNCGKTGLPIIARFAGDPIADDKVFKLNAPRLRDVPGREIRRTLACNSLRVNYGNGVVHFLCARNARANGHEFARKRRSRILKERVVTDSQETWRRKRGSSSDYTGRNCELLGIAFRGRSGWRRCRGDRCSPETGYVGNQRFHIGSIQTQRGHAGSFHGGTGRFQNYCQLSWGIL